MARRKRLTPPRSDYLEADASAPLETKSMPRGMLPPRDAPVASESAPIARVAGDASASAALADLAEEMRAARAEGRLVQALPLDSIDADYLIRDRLSVDTEELDPLIASIRVRGQQAPVEVVELDAGRFGLISGWRRLTALRRLHAETGESRFATVQALLRKPEGAAEAYRAMIEENEIRAGLSYYERARIAARAAEAGVYADARSAVRALFAAASRARRSKIASFLTVHAALDDRLRFPTAIPERLGLALARALEADPAFAGRLRERLRKNTAREAGEEMALLDRALGRTSDASSISVPKSSLNPPVETEYARPVRPAARPVVDAPPLPHSRPASAEELVPGLWLQAGGDHPGARLTLSGPRVDAAFHARLIAWLKGEDGAAH